MTDTGNYQQLCRHYDTTGNFAMDEIVFFKLRIDDTTEQTCPTSFNCSMYHSGTQGLFRSAGVNQTILLHRGVLPTLQQETPTISRTSLGLGLLSQLRVCPSSVDFSSSTNL